MTEQQVLEALAKFIRETGVYPWSCGCCNGLNLFSVEDGENSIEMDGVEYDEERCMVTYTNYGEKVEKFEVPV